MAQNFIACDRGQTMLMPPDLTDWVPDDQVVRSILGAVEQMDLTGFYGVYRENGQGRAAYEASMMVALLLYAYAHGNRSSRGIERECREDVVYKLITAMRMPDHSTIAEFRRRHERALGELFTSVLALCREAGLVEVGVISIDGTKIRANASRGAVAGHLRCRRLGFRARPADACFEDVSDVGPVVRLCSSSDVWLGLVVGGR